MSTNMGTTDRIFRVLAAVLIIALAFGFGILGTGLLKWAGLAVAVVFVGTALFANCPFYTLLGVKTCRSSS